MKEGGANLAMLSRPEGQTALHLAARWGHVGVLQALIRHLEQSSVSTPGKAESASAAIVQEHDGVGVDMRGDGASENCSSSSSQSRSSSSAAGRKAVRAYALARNSHGQTALDEARTWGRRQCEEYLAVLTAELDLDDGFGKG